MVWFWMANGKHKWVTEVERPYARNTIGFGVERAPFVPEPVRGDVPSGADDGSPASVEPVEIREVERDADGRPEAQATGQGAGTCFSRLQS